MFAHRRREPLRRGELTPAWEQLERRGPRMGQRLREPRRVLAKAGRPAARQSPPEPRRAPCGEPDWLGQAQAPRATPQRALRQPVARPKLRARRILQERVRQGLVPQASRPRGPAVLRSLRPAFRSALFRRDRLRLVPLSPAHRVPEPALLQRAVPSAQVLAPGRAARQRGQVLPPEQVPAPALGPEQARAQAPAQARVPERVPHPETARRQEAFRWAASRLAQGELHRVVAQSQRTGRTASSTPRVLRPSASCRPFSCLA